MIRSIILFLLILLFPVKSFTDISQITYPIDTHDGQVIETCIGFFVDSGKDTLTNYGSNENYSVTFTSSDEEKPFLSVEFIFFDLGPGDYLYVYDGGSSDAPLLFQATNDELTGVKIFPTSDSLHFHFESSPSEHGRGWWADIRCYEICELFAADITTNLQTLKLCPDTGPVTLIAEAYYKSEAVVYDPDQIEYQWYYNGQAHTGATLDHEFYDPGAYPFHINIYDPVNNCELDFYETVQVGTIPYFAGTQPNRDTICAEDPIILTGVANMVTWTGFPTSVHDTVPIPDGTTESYVSTLTFDVFEEDDILESEDDFGRICLIIDHVDQSHLRFELLCPDGSQVMLKDYGGVNANLGEPVVYDNVTPGIGYEYCFTPTPEYGLMNHTTPNYHGYTDQAGNYYANAAYLPEGTYTSYESLENLTGCPLNGTWTLTVTDNTPTSNGYMSGWNLFFHDDFYPDSLIFTPEVVSEIWYDNGNPLEGNPATAIKDEKGDYEFRFEITDNFNCTYDTTVYVNILPLPEAEIISYHQVHDLTFCEGDSTLLTVNPVNNDGYNWIYQWYLENTQLPGRTYDTLMAKETGTYRVDITDTISGCLASVEIEITDENCELQIPNVFTPNYDGINDYFEIINLEHYEKARIIIYNRWGDKVFEHSNYYGNWWAGEGAPDGVYYYVLTYERLGVKRRAHGVVHIVR